MKSMHPPNHMNYSKIFFFFFVFSSFCAPNIIQEREERDFVVSFIDNYGFTPNARDTHEYHSFILGNTRESFMRLERQLSSQGFDLAGRMVICGYQEDAVPSYYTAGTRHTIDDEVSLKTKSGWQFASGNLFGFLTGFLLKDVNLLKKKGVQTIFEHIRSHDIGIYDDHATIFQKHAFGSAYNGLMYAKKFISKALIEQNPKKIISLLRNLWKYLYVHGISDGSNVLLATQDILFSIHYARYLLDSTLPFLKFYIGPDITYPIEELRCQKLSVTTSAQQFVERFVNHIGPIDNEKTAYIFCSFVDGVGKSTLLGNIRNWALHGADFAKYERVDNSSSQRATVWTLKPGVVIADLPAQASHFIAKPDGMVYVDVNTVKDIDDAALSDVQNYVKLHQETLKGQFEEQLLLLQRLPKNNLMVSENESPAHAYTKNCALLDVKQPQWIPCEYQGKHYIFDNKNPTRLRVLMPFEGVHSYGLKVAEPEQMIFNKGISVPLSQDLFLKDLSGQLKAAGVQKVVFVDFMSMYPRTSRENIRVNFLLQHMSGLFGNSFDLTKSLYKGFVQPQEVFLLLKKNHKEVLQALMQETCVRWALCEIMQECAHTEKALIPCDKIMPLLHAKYDALYAQHKNHLIAVATNKIKQEYVELLKAYELERDFETLVQFEFGTVVEFSRHMHHVCTSIIKDSSINALWDGMNAVTVGPDNKLYFMDGSQAEELYVFDASCRDKIALKECFATIRAHWYVTLTHMLYAQQTDDGRFVVQKNRLQVPSLAVIADGQGLVRVVRKKLFPINDPEVLAKLKPPAAFFDTTIKKNQLKWGTFTDIPHCLDWSSVKTDVSMFAFSYNAPQLKEKNAITRLVEQYKFFRINDQQKNFCMPTSLLSSTIATLGMWPAVKKEIARLATELKNKGGNLQTPAKGCREGARYFMRAVATLEMILKDLSCDIVVRKGQREDFAAALQLLEKITLPAYFSLSFDKPLFEDYAKIEPLISWEIFDAC